MVMMMMIVISMMSIQELNLFKANIVLDISKLYKKS